jgi:DNA repair protein RecO (recombination protein O)
MFVSVRAIALRTIKVNDSKSILSAWSAELGRISLVMPAGGGKESRRRRALTMPLSCFEGVVDVRPHVELYSIRDVRACEPMTSLSAHPVRSAVAMFLAEVLGVVLRDSQPDAVLWQFLQDSVTTLDRVEGRALANFHLVFLVHLGQFLGIYPDTSSWAEGRVFDMRDAVFRDSAPGHNDYIEAAQAKAVRALALVDYDSMGRLAFVRSERSDALDAILRYYAIHHTPLASIKSLEVVRMLTMA